MTSVEAWLATTTEKFQCLAEHGRKWHVIRVQVGCQDNFTVVLADQTGHGHAHAGGAEGAVQFPAHAGKNRTEDVHHFFSCWHPRDVVGDPFEYPV